MKGILIIVVWAIVVITTIAGYFVWERARTMVVKENKRENDKDVINRYGYLRIISVFVLIGLFIIAIVSFLEATDTGNYLKF